MKHTMKGPSVCRLIAGVSLGLACVLSLPVVAFAEPGVEPPANMTSASALVPQGRAGQWINVDPRTGARVAPSVAIVPGPAFSTSHAGLVEETAPGGGVMINLQGRFRSAATATVGTDGKATVDCVPPGTAHEEQRP